MIFDAKSMRSQIQESYLPENGFVSYQDVQVNDFLNLNLRFRKIAPIQSKEEEILFQLTSLGTILIISEKHEQGDFCSFTSGGADSSTVCHIQSQTMVSAE